jgi:hypothetical protein
MFKTPKQLQDFILWCQKNKVKSFNNNEIQFELSELAFVPDMNTPQEILEKSNLNDHKSFIETEELSPEEEDELLYWSSGTIPKNT